MTNRYSHMHFVGYKSIPNWSAGYILGHDLGFSEKYPLARIGDFIRPAKNAIVVEDDKEYKQVTLKTNGGGAVLRGVMKGSSIGTKKQFLAKEGQFVMSKIDARNGAFGIISKELNGAIVTGDFPLFDVNSDLISTEYLFLISTTKSFVRFAQSCSRGTTNRRRIDVNLFLQQQIPLPSLDEQKALVDAYQEKLQDASILDKSLSVIADEIDKFVLGKLEVTKHSSMTFDGKDSCFSFLKFISSSNISRWDVFNEKQELKSWKYENTTLSHVLLEKPAYGAGYKSAKKPNDIRYIRITDINEDGTLNDEFVSANEYEEKYLLKPNDFLIARSGNTVGKTFLYEPKWGKAIFAGYLIRFVLDTEKINPYYLLAYTKSSIFKKWITNNMRVSGQPNINSQQYLDASLILPPLSVQQEIVDEVQKRRAQIASCREQAAKLRQDAIAQFEQAIFE